MFTELLPLGPLAVIGVALMIVPLASFNGVTDTGVATTLLALLALIMIGLLLQ